jgi:hypothetical protein
MPMWVGIDAPAIKYLVWQWLEKIVLGINFCEIIGYSEYFCCGVRVWVWVRGG